MYCRLSSSQHRYLSSTSLHCSIWVSCTSSFLPDLKKKHIELTDEYLYLAFLEPWYQLWPVALSLACFQLRIDWNGMLQQILEARTVKQEWNRASDPASCCWNPHDKRALPIPTKLYWSNSTYTYLRKPYYLTQHYFEARCDSFFWYRISGSCKGCELLLLLDLQTQNLPTPIAPDLPDARCQTTMEIADASYFYTIGKNCRSANIV